MEALSVSCSNLSEILPILFPHQGRWVVDFQVPVNSKPYVVYYIHRYDVYFITINSLYQYWKKCLIKRGWKHRYHLNKTRYNCIQNRKPIGLHSHLSILNLYLYTDFLLKVLIIAYQQHRHRIKKINNGVGSTIIIPYHNNN